VELEHSFTVPADIDTAWNTLLDVERIAMCMPGATLISVEGDTFKGEVKIKLGPVTMVFGGTASGGQARSQRGSLAPGLEPVQIGSVADFDGN
jgi:carbon monoxide dehydrogenase subunit G